MANRKLQPFWMPGLCLNRQEHSPKPKHEYPLVIVSFSYSIMPHSTTDTSLHHGIFREPRSLPAEGVFSLEFHLPSFLDIQALGDCLEISQRIQHLLYTPAIVSFERGYSSWLSTIVRNLCGTHEGTGNADNSISLNVRRRARTALSPNESRRREDARRQCYEDYFLMASIQADIVHDRSHNLQIAYIAAIAGFTNMTTVVFDVSCEQPRCITMAGLSLPGFSNLDSPDGDVVPHSTYLLEHTLQDVSVYHVREFVPDILAAFLKVLMTRHEEQTPGDTPSVGLSLGERNRSQRRYVYCISYCGKGT